MRLGSAEGSVLCAQGSGSCAVQPLLPVSFLHPRSVLLYAVLQRLRGESGTPPGLLKLLARHREYIITPHSRQAQACGCNKCFACGDTVPMDRVGGVFTKSAAPSATSFKDATSKRFCKISPCPGASLRGLQQGCIKVKVLGLW